TGKLDTQQILEKIRLYTGKKIEYGKTLLFLDEIQECPLALKMLRYFKERCPELHVIAAGSLLDFLLEKISMPVGRVQFLYCYPLSFGEFLTASDRSDLREYIRSEDIDPSIHIRLLELLKTYMWLGGMPAVVDAWLKLADAEKCCSLQDRIITAYQQDFLKYAKKNQIRNVESVFLSIPKQLGNKFKYTSVDNTGKSQSLKNALSLLFMAGISYPCFHSSGQGHPLGANKNEKRFKVFFFDVGLAQRIMGLTLKDWVTAPIDVKYLGAVAEQLIAQEYIAYSNPEKPYELYYWHREEAGSNAEVDFLFLKDKLIIPVEVKSGVKGGMKSIKQFLNTHPHSKYGLKISQGIKQQNQHMQEISLYGLEAWLKS
ncbi:MAG: ATP-binding protein, partial [Gammaproteobacteria bacterium]